MNPCAASAVKDDENAGADDGQSHDDNGCASQEFGHEGLPKCKSNLVTILAMTSEPALNVATQPGGANVMPMP